MRMGAAKGGPIRKYRTRCYILRIRGLCPPPPVLAKLGAGRPPEKLMYIRDNIICLIII
jgi:hypothetical protein